MQGFVLDCRHALKLYAKTPVASLVAVGVLAIGLAFVSAFLSLYVDLVLRPVPGFEDSGDIVTVGWSNGENMNGLFPGLILRAHDETASLEALAGALSREPVLFGPERTSIRAESVTRGFFDGLRPRLALGRGLAPEDHGLDARLAAVISYDFWRAEFAGDPDILGTTIELITQRGAQDSVEESHNVEVIGVMAPEMRGVTADDIAVWLPMERMVLLQFGGVTDIAEFSLYTSAIGRKAAGVSVTAVANELRSRFGSDVAESGMPETFRLDAVGGIVSSIPAKRESVRQLNVFLGGSILLALVAACNVSLFLLARAPGRRRELATRLAVGAPFRRLARQLWREAGVLVVAAAVLGMILSIWLSSFLQGLAFLRRAEWRHVTLLDWRVAVLVGAFLVCITLAVSIVPVLGLKRLGIFQGSRQVAARATPAQRVAGSVQLAISGAVGGAAVAFAWYVGAMVLGHPGYNTANRQVAIFSSFTQSELAVGRLREAILSVPGVSNAGIGSAVPGGGDAGVGLPAGTTRRIPGALDASEPFEFRAVLIDEHYIDILGLRLLAGRKPEAGELDAGLVNETLARRYFGRDDVVGEILPLGDRGSRQARIVGVVEDLSYEHPASAAPPMVFTTTAAAVSSPWPVAIVETELSTADLRQQLRGLVDSGRIEIALAGVRPLIEMRREIIAPDRARAFLTIVTCVIVVTLAGFGFYGIQRYLVAAGRREYAIRAALGAGPGSIVKLVLLRAIYMSLPGLALGLLLAFIGVAWLRDDFIPREISPTAVTLAVFAGLVALLLAASFGPARQARRTQPAPILRED